MSPTHADTELVKATRSKARKDLAAGFISLACAGVLAVHHFSQEGRLHQDFGAEPGPALLPELLMTLLALVGVLLIARALWLGASIPSFAMPVPGELLQSKQTAVVYLAALLFVPIHTVTGFGVATCAMGAILSLLCAHDPARNKLRSMIEGGLVAFALYTMFRFGLSVPLT